MAKLTFSEIDKMDDRQIAKLSESELKEAIRAMQKSISQRVRRLKEQGLGDSPFVEKVKTDGAPRKTEKNGAPLSINRLRSELYRGKKLLNMKTAKITGARKFEEKMEAAWGFNWKDDVNFDKIKDIRKLIKLYMDLYSSDATSYESDQIKEAITYVYEQNEKHSVVHWKDETIVKRAHEKLIKATTPKTEPKKDRFKAGRVV